MKLAWVCAAALAVAGCGQAAIVQAKKLVEAELIDPRSAQYEDVKASGAVVCGRVNAKNRMGGYVGFKRFFVDTEKSTVMFEPDAAGDLSQPEEQAKAYRGVTFDLAWAQCPA